MSVDQACRLCKVTESIEMAGVAANCTGTNRARAESNRNASRDDHEGRDEGSDAEALPGARGGPEDDRSEQSSKHEDDDDE